MPKIPTSRGAKTVADALSFDPRVPTVPYTSPSSAAYLRLHVNRYSPINTYAMDTTKISFTQVSPTSGKLITRKMTIMLTVNALGLDRAIVPYQIGDLRPSSYRGVPAHEWGFAYSRSSNTALSKRVFRRYLRWLSPQVGTGPNMLLVKCTPATQVPCSLVPANIKLVYIFTSIAPPTIHPLDTGLADKFLRQFLEHKLVGDLESLTLGSSSLSNVSISLFCLEDSQ